MSSTTWGDDITRKTSIALAVCTLAAHALSGAATVQAAPTTLLGVYEEYVFTNCAVGTGCFVFFSTVPANTIISTVSCNFYINASNVSLTGIAFGQAASANASQFKPAQYVNVPAAFNNAAAAVQFQFLANIQHVVPQNTKPAIQIGWNKQATGAAYCSISGTTNVLLPP